MAVQLKDAYNKNFVEIFLEKLGSCYPEIDKEKFTKEIFDENWDQKELKQRMRHITQTMFGHLPKQYDDAIEILLQLTKILQNSSNGKMGFEYMFIPDYVEVYGQENVELSIKAMEKITQLNSAEFAVRPFIKSHPEKMMDQLLKWSSHNHAMVRRLASEGCRPRLPWGMGIPFLKKDPSSILPILENLKCDPSETVRRSVANNLNDISKDHPKTVIEITKKWKGISPETDKLVKHANRTLLKQAHPTVMEIFGFGTTNAFKVEGLSLINNEIKIGDDLLFEFSLSVTSPNPILLRIEYGIDYLKSNGKHNKKKFKITENTYSNRAPIFFKRKQSFKNMTTRKHYEGEHHLSIIVNGIEMGSITFDLTK